MSASFELQGDVGVLRLDDGKANALDDTMLDALASGMERAKAEAKALLIVGREGRFSAGFNLKALAQDPHGLVTRGARVLLDLYAHPQPVIAACTGHAVAGGAVLLLCCDHRVGTQGEFKIGLSEVQIGMPMPAFVSGLARERLVRTEFDRATLFATMYDPNGAARAGYLDEVTDSSPFETALDKARVLAALPGPAYAGTKWTARGALIERIRAGLDEDITRIVAVMAEGRGA